MSKGKAARMEHQSLNAHMCCKGSVLMLVPVLGIPNDGVSKVPHVQPDLMVPACMWDALDQAKSGGVIPGYRVLELAPFQRLEFCSGFFRRAIHAFWQWLGDSAFVVNMTPHQCQVFFCGFSGLKLCLASVDGRGVFSKDDDATGRFIESVNWVQSPGIVAS
jgi:hypothetical protein